MIPDSCQCGALTSWRCVPRRGAKLRTRGPSEMIEIIAGFATATRPGKINRLSRWRNRRHGIIVERTSRVLTERTLRLSIPQSYDFATSLSRSRRRDEAFPFAKHRNALPSRNKAVGNDSLPGVIARIRCVAYINCAIHRVIAEKSSSAIL